MHTLYWQVQLTIDDCFSTLAMQLNHETVSHLQIGLKTCLLRNDSLNMLIWANIMNVIVLQKYLNVAERDVAKNMGKYQVVSHSMNSA